MSKSKGKTGTELELAGDDDLIQGFSGGSDDAALDQIVSEEFSPADELRRAGLSCEVVRSLTEGQQIRGILLGNGATIDMDSMVNAGTKVQVKTWRIRALKGGIVIVLIGSSQLDQRLAAFAPGTEVLIQHHGKVKTRKGFSANDYVVWAGRRHDVPELAMLPAAALAAPANGQFRANS